MWHAYLQLTFLNSANPLPPIVLGGRSAISRGQTGCHIMHQSNCVVCMLCSCTGLSIQAHHAHLLLTPNSNKQASVPVICNDKAGRPSKFSPAVVET